MSRLFLLVCLLLAPGIAAGQEIRYAATIQPLAAILEKVVGERGKVVRLLPPGSSPHTFEPRPSDAVMLEGSLALFYVGPNLDREWTQGLPAARRVEMLQLVPHERLLTLSGHGHGEGEAEHAETGAVDPHFWTDPLTVKSILPALVERLAELDPAGRALYERSAAAFAVELEQLHVRVAALLLPIKGKPILLFHPSFQYLIKRYDLNLAALIEPFPGREPSPKALHELIGKVGRLQARALFTEPQLSARPARVVAEAAGLDLYELDPLGGTENRRSYEEIILYNARTLNKALM